MKKTKTKIWFLPIRSNKFFYIFLIDASGFYE